MKFVGEIPAPDAQQKQEDAQHEKVVRSQVEPQRHYYIECSCGFKGMTVTEEDRGGWEACPNCGMI